MYLNWDGKKREREREVTNTGERKPTIIADSPNPSISLHYGKTLSRKDFFSKSPCAQHMVCVHTEDRRIELRRDSRFCTVRES
jgi:hypothetical protein